jgi:hypothetical protein
MREIQFESSVFKLERLVPRCDGKEDEDVGTGSLRRQSSAFEFRSRSQKAEHGPRVEPVYENLRRDATSRASLRQAEFFFYTYIFLRARVCWPLLCLIPMLLNHQGTGITEKILNLQRLACFSVRILLCF